MKLERDFLFVQDDGDALGAGRIDCAIEFENHGWEKYLGDMGRSRLLSSVGDDLHLMTKPDKFGVRHQRRVQ